MPWSRDSFDNYVVEYIHRHWKDDKRPILDIGAGAGKYGKLLARDDVVDAIEVFEPYVERFSLGCIYRYVFRGRCHQAETGIAAACL